MSIKFSIYTFAAVCLLHINGFADNHNIDQDTIRIPMGKSVLVRFPGEVDIASTLCNKTDYSTVYIGTNLELKSNIEAGSNTFCNLFVKEGDKNTGSREHVFILMTVTNNSPFEAIYDIHTLKLIETRKAAIEARKNGKGIGAVPDIHNNSAPSSVSEPITANTAASASSQPDGSSIDSAIYKIDQEALKDQIQKKVDAFYKCCTRLGRKIDVTETLNLAMTLFNNNDDKIVESISAKTGVRKNKKIRDYLIGLSQLSYTGIKILSKKIQFVSNIQKNTDGTYHATATVYQVFEGMRGERTVYRDETVKTLDIEIVANEVVKEGKIITTWDIFLGDIKVEELK